MVVVVAAAVAAAAAAAAAVVLRAVTASAVATETRHATPQGGGDGAGRWTPASLPVQGTYPL